MVHLEALELLNARCETDLRERLSGATIPAIHSKLAAIKDLFNDDDDEDNDDDDEDIAFCASKEELLRELMKKHCEGFQSDGGSSPTMLAAAERFVDAIREAHRSREEMEARIQGEEKEADNDWEEANWEEVEDDEDDGATKPEPSSVTPPTPADVHRACIQNLAKLVAQGIQLYHKTGQSTLMPPSPTEKPTECDIDAFIARATHLVALSKLIETNVDAVAKVFGQVALKFP